MLDLPIWAEAVGRGLILTVLALAWTMLLVRVVGLRALSEMSAVDFVSTVATGAIVGTAATAPDIALFLQCLAALVALFAFQWATTRLATKSKKVQSLVRNKPVLVMENGRFLEKAMERTGVSREELLEQLRSASVTDLATVRAVVIETTGNLTVVKGDRVDPLLLEDVTRL